MEENFPCTATLYAAHPSGKQRKVVINFNGSTNKLLDALLEKKRKARSYRYEGVRIEVITCLGQYNVVYMDDEGEMLIDKYGRVVANKQTVFSYYD